MNDTWKKIQSLRVASGWSIDVNNFYEYEPTIENMTWFYGSILISGHNNKGLCFDARYEPEGDPNGEFVVDFLKLSKKGEDEAFLGSMKTKSKQKLIEFIEYFMFTEEVPK
ncbi:hypothetical protein E7W39_04700 [Cronobacter sakazakii]|uniref:hypothetical protein n=2 Tax=Cronobacter sakazakii TaxID=28141 RepID=UPI00084E2E33|nr:hypothetical protein [Cronobacter sakazakii]EIX1505927.1 hypothetical protein [Cronobacter sakazakii]EIX1527067.1 hypothetical protein [Cronobacter sakazakii]EIX1535936.1 hypothetical protein [Cronobacter sakazakii]EIX1624570.1 hypothetical protein [Cronobacter sakazakii]EIX1665867.1 hypothetical protein [Cronobacter sakazakii]